MPPYGFQVEGVTQSKAHLEVDPCSCFFIREEDFDLAIGSRLHAQIMVLIRFKYILHGRGSFVLVNRYYVYFIGGG